MHLTIQLTAESPWTLICKEVQHYNSPTPYTPHLHWGQKEREREKEIKRVEPAATNFFT